ncbi:thermonuclease family protein [Bradyrhizobium sp. UFLA01-814]|uniref:thermonuclease family protein n=1 Tax=Bradyrhizobium sp. UFLA01-814 TaxID=3023480 RepID=UPI00398A9045
MALADQFVGQTSVIDGDTLEIHGTRIRLWGVDAPESSQLCRGDDSLQYRCGAQAANDLDGFIARRPVNCVPLSLDQYGRTVTTCSVGRADLGEWLVLHGLALDWPQYSKGRYGVAQHNAERAGRGIWKAVMSNRGSTAPVSVRTASRPPARMMQAPIRDQLRTASRSLQVTLAWFGRLTLTNRHRLPHCMIGTTWLQPPVNCHLLVTRSKWMAD